MYLLTHTSTYLRTFSHTRTYFHTYSPLVDKTDSAHQNIRAIVQGQYQTGLSLLMDQNLLVMTYAHTYETLSELIAGIMFGEISGNTEEIKEKRWREEGSE